MRVHMQSHEQTKSTRLRRTTHMALQPSNLLAQVRQHACELVEGGVHGIWLLQGASGDGDSVRKLQLHD